MVVSRKLISTTFRSREEEDRTSFKVWFHGELLAPYYMLKVKSQSAKFKKKEEEEEDEEEKLMENTELVLVAKA